MFVTALETNLKYVRKVDMGPLTIITGPNGAGKSAIIDALLLALNGVPRSPYPNKRGMGLLLAAGETELRAVATLSDGSTVGWQHGAKTTRPTKALATVLNDCVSVIFGETSSSLLKLACQLSPTVTKRESVEAIVTRDAVRILREYLPESFKADDLLAVDAKIRARQRSAKRNHTEAEKALETVSTNVNPLSQEEEQELAVLAVKRAAKLRLKSLGSEEIERRLSDVSKIEYDEVAFDATRAVQAAIAKVLNLAKGRKTLRCPICQTPSSSDVLRARHDALQDACTEICRARRLSDPGLEEREVTKRDIETAKGFDDRRYHALMKRQEAVVSAVANETAARQLKDEYLAIKEVHEVVTKVYETQARQVLSDLQHRLNDVLPGGWRILINVNGTNVVASVQCGAQREFVPVQCLSGAERSLLSCSISSAIVGNGEQIRLLLIDDVWMDDTHLADTLVACRNAVKLSHATQAILCCVSQYNVDVSGCNVIDLGK